MSSKFPNAKTDAEFRAQLTPQEYNCLRRAGTEAPETGEYFKFFPKAGHFACRACKLPLYNAGSKFRDCGWDAFDKVFWDGDKCHVGCKADMGCLEIICNGCGSHLGHVFYNEHHTATDERHCVNSICIRYVKEPAPDNLHEAKMEVPKKFQKFTTGGGGCNTQ